MMLERGRVRDDMRTSSVDDRASSCRSRSRWPSQGLRAAPGRGEPPFTAKSARPAVLDARSTATPTRADRCVDRFTERTSPTLDESVAGAPVGVLRPLDLIQPYRRRWGRRSPGLVPGRDQSRTRDPR
ncbi:MAG: hypothetical protein R2710_05560 [Acidimicrobiales bacterium]